MNFRRSQNRFSEDSVSERNFDWNLAFASDEVVEGVEKICHMEGYSYTKEQTGSETLFDIILPDGNAILRIRSQDAQQAPFNPMLKFQRTFLAVSMPEVGAQTVETLHRKLTLAFLRAGG